MQLEPAQIFTILITIIGAGVSAYVGVKVALAEIRIRLANVEARLLAHDTRLDRIEKTYFDK